MCRRPDGRRTETTSKTTHGLLSSAFPGPSRTLAYVIEAHLAHTGASHVETRSGGFAQSMYKTNIGYILCASVPITGSIKAARL